MGISVNANGESIRRIQKITILAINQMLSDNKQPQQIKDRKEADYVVRIVNGKTLYDGRIVVCEHGKKEADKGKGEERLLVFNSFDGAPKKELESDEMLIDGRVRVVEYSIIYIPLAKEEKARLENNNEFKDKQIE